LDVVTRSLRWQALWVVAAGAGFWAVSTAMVLALVAAGIGIFEYAPEWSFGGAAALGLSGVLALGLLPPLSRAKADPTPPLASDEHPRLRELVDDVAMRVGTEAPKSLYLFHAANAFAGARRPRMLAPKESIVGIGLPLLAVLTKDEARAVVAHEMGHHIAGDLRLGPWVHRTRNAIARAVERLEGSSFFLHLPFVAYSGLFLKTSVRVSRAQELQADAVSAKVTGALVTASALRKTEALSLVWDTYFSSEVLPLLSRGRNPPLLEGFERYREATEVPTTPAFEALQAARERARHTHAEDTHPPLEERLAALGEPAAMSLRGPNALALLDDPREEEARVLRLLLLKERQSEMKPISWDAIVDEVWLPGWRDAISTHEKALERMAPMRLIPAVLDRWEELAEATRRGLAILSPAAERRRVTGLLGMWLCVSLANRGFRIEAPPGWAVRAEKESTVVEPFAVVTAMSKGKTAATDWGSRCDEWGL
jgi:Zn-dependent protease with chaperone function